MAGFVPLLATEETKVLQAICPGGTTGHIAEKLAAQL